MTFKAAAIQMCSGVDPAENAGTMARLVREAAAQGATYVQTPEMTGALQRDRAAMKAALRDEGSDLIVAAASKLAGELRIHLHVGSTAIGLADGKMANRGFLFGPRWQKDYPLRQDPHVRRRSRQWRKLARKCRLYAGGDRKAGEPAVRQARLRHLLRRTLPRAVPGAGSGGC